MGCGALVFLMWSFCQNVVRRRESSLSVKVRGSCVVSGECWPTELMWVLRVRGGVWRLWGAKAVSPDSFGEFGVGSSVGIDCVKEEAVDAQDALKVGEAQVLGRVGEIGGEGVHRDDWG